MFGKVAAAAVVALAVSSGAGAAGWELHSLAQIKPSVARALRSEAPPMRQVRSRVRRVAPGHSALVVAECRPGDVVMSGGYVGTAPDSSAPTPAGSPVAGWEIELRNRSSKDVVAVRAVALCARL